MVTEAAKEGSCGSVFVVGALLHQAVHDLSKISYQFVPCALRLTDRRFLQAQLHTVAP